MGLPVFPFSSALLERFLEWNLGRSILGKVLGLGCERKRCFAYCDMECHSPSCQMVRYSKIRGIASIAIFGNVVTAWSWFGTNILGVNGLPMDLWTGHLRSFD